MHITEDDIEKMIQYPESMILKKNESRRIKYIYRINTGHIIKVKAKILKEELNKFPLKKNLFELKKQMI